MKTHLTSENTRRALALAALLLVTACGRAHVAVGVSTSNSLTAAARMAFHDAAAAAPIEWLDTVFIPESSNLAAPALSSADSLVGVPGMVAVVGHSNSQASLAAAPVYAQHGVVELSPTSSASAFAGSCSFCFSLVPPDDQQGRFIAAHLRSMAPAGARVAVLYVNDDYGRGLHAAFKAAVDTVRYPVVLDLPHMQSSDLPQQAAETADALRSSHPDVVVWLARGAVLTRYIDAIRGAVPGIPIFGADAMGTGIMDPGAERWAGVSYVAFVDMGSTQPLRSFADRLTRTYHAQASDAAALTYDATSLIVAGLRSGVRTGDGMREFLVSLGRSRPAFQGITGTISFDPEGRVERSYVVKKLGPAGAR